MRVALVLGSAARVWSDAAAASELGSYQGATGCNDLGVVWPAPLDAWVSQHADLFRRYVAQREARGLPPHRRILAVPGARSEPRLSPAVTGFTEHTFPGQTSSGTSGLFALKVALIDLGFDRAVLCGIPMQDAAAHLRDADAPWVGETMHWAGWLEAYPQIKDRARSMSGRTAELLGRPTAEWVAGA